MASNFTRMQQLLQTLEAHLQQRFRMLFSSPTQKLLSIT